MRGMNERTDGIVIKAFWWTFSYHYFFSASNQDISARLHPSLGFCRRGEKRERLWGGLAKMSWFGAENEKEGWDLASRQWLRAYGVVVEQFRWNEDECMINGRDGEVMAKTWFSLPMSAETWQSPIPKSFSTNTKVYILTTLNTWTPPYTRFAASRQPTPQTWLQSDPWQRWTSSISTRAT